MLTRRVHSATRLGSLLDKLAYSRDALLLALLIKSGAAQAQRHYAVNHADALREVVRRGFRIQTSGPARRSGSPPDAGTVETARGRSAAAQPAVVAPRRPPPAPLRPIGCTWSAIQVGL